MLKNELYTRSISEKCDMNKGDPQIESCSVAKQVRYDIPSYLTCCYTIILLFRIPSNVYPFADGEFCGYLRTVSLDKGRI